MSWFSGQLATDAVSIVSDGIYLYIGGNTNISRVKISDKTVDTNWCSNAISGSHGLAIDNTYLYVSKYNEYHINRIRLSDAHVDPSWITDIGGFVCFSLNNGFLYASLVDDSKIVKINLADKSKNSNWAIHTSNRPYGSVAVGNFLYVICQSGVINKISLLDGTIVSQNFAPSIYLGNALSITGDSNYLYATNNNTKQIVKISIADGSVVNDNLISYTNTFTDCVIDNYLYVLNNGTINRISVLPPSTPIYLGNATITNTGDFNLSNTVLTSTRFPVDQHELVPRAYVDTYISSVKAYYDHILDPNGDLKGILDRLSYAEAQLNRVYKALWNVERDVSAIVTPQLGSLAANYVAAEAPNPTLIANPPSAPASLSGFN